VFVGGDLVIGYADDGGKILRGQLDGWANLVKAEPLWKRTTIIPFPGNHELDTKIGKERRTNLPATAIWNSWFSAEGFRQMGSNGPKAGVLGDQSKLSYSFDAGSVHFVILNTDTAIQTPEVLADSAKVAQIPLKWATDDIELAQRRSSVKTIIVMGHRNLIDPAGCAGDSPIDKESGSHLLQAIRMSSKVKAYVCAHVHAWDETLIGGQGGTWQVVAGNGGSKLEEAWNPQGGTYFGFAVFQLYKSGKVVLQKFSRPTPTPPQTYFEVGTQAPPPATMTERVLYSPMKRLRSQS
jgi:hypothetical protein